MGQYQLDPAQSDSVPEAIERSLAELNPLLRVIVRRAIQSVKLVHPSLGISRSGAKLTLLMGGSPPMTGPADGTPFTWTREDGAVLEVSLKLTGQRLVQTLKPKSREPQRVSTFEATPDGQALRMAVRFASGGSGTPLAYKLVYRRL